MKSRSTSRMLVVILAVSAISAYADTIQLGSYGTGDPSLGNNNSALVYGGSISSSGPYATNPSGDITSGTGTTFDISVVSPWIGPLSNSSWVSQNANSEPGGGYAAPNGYYTFTTTFSATGGVYNGSLNLLADDTVAVYLDGNSTPLVLAGAIGSVACSSTLPTCTQVNTVGLSNVMLASGTNKLTFVVEQQAGGSEGLDFDGSLTSATSEPSTLMLLATALLGSISVVKGRASSRLGACRKEKACDSASC